MDSTWICKWWQNSGNKGGQSPNSHLWRRFGLWRYEEHGARLHVTSYFERKETLTFTLTDDWNLIVCVIILWEIEETKSIFVTEDYLLSKAINMEKQEGVRKHGKVRKVMNNHQLNTRWFNLMFLCRGPQPLGPRPAWRHESCDSRMKHFTDYWCESTFLM